MSRPSSFIATTDFATLKNDGRTTISLTLPGSVSVAAGQTYSLTQDVTVGRSGASTRARIASSKDGTRFYALQTLSVGRYGTVTGEPAFYDVFAHISRVSATTLRASVIIQNPYSDPLVCTLGDETFTFHVNTFVPPFA